LLRPRAESADVDGHTRPFGKPALRAYPAVPVRHAAVRELEAMDHPMPRKPVLRRIGTKRVRAVADQHARQPGGQLAAHRQRAAVDFEIDRRRVGAVAIRFQTFIHTPAQIFPMERF
jgi:hypothetical protein